MRLCAHRSIINQKMLRKRPLPVRYSPPIVIGLLLVLLGLAGCRPAATSTPTAIAARTSTPLPSPTITVSPSPTAIHTSTALPTPTSEPWVSYWPKGQTTNQITALAIAPSDEKTVYASTSAALYRSTDGGKSWAVVSTLPNLVALTVDPTNRDNLYAYFWPKLIDSPPEPKGFRKSSDGGRSWSDPSNGASADLIGPATTVAIGPFNPNIILIGTAYYRTYGRILSSTDGGATWQVTYTINSLMGAGDITDIAIHPTSASIVYAGHTVYHGGPVIRSDDGGLSWQYTATVPMPLSFPAGLALDPSDPDIVYVAYQAPMGAGAAVYRSRDGGLSWTKASNGLPEEAASGAHLAIDPVNPRVLFLSIQGLNAGIYRTKDGADSWARLSPEGTSQFAYVTSLSYSPVEHTLYAGTNEGVWQRGPLP